MSQPLLKVVDLFCERDERTLFDGLAFTLAAGELMQIEGANGSGKTTLLRILSGLSNDFEGEIYWRGELIAKMRDEFLSSMLYFGHQPGVKGMLTPVENLQWYSAIHPALSEEKILAALDAVGLKGYEDVPCHSLSAGQNRRVSLARLYMNTAKLWILDEPFTAIDKRGVAAKEKWLAGHVAAGGSVILTTHHDLTSCGPVTKINLDQLMGT
ncbi:cytochrome c biogenesis heme-transporting ATPase CcmA [Neptunomonas qingdaonensis]|uniref:Heme exporter protein A n=1 Tax=Neptunomonas qingdaonensis TaxID=1045558 RepID=A0A1I2MYM3_9GAMM|nr:cytochrome c biogenesis heme-transporting ATPase CcmA [Neptunomonas qingdaonensis]SFF96543.1 heme exporter protein A [Neptunomonas qingdaonensis]